MFYIILYVTVYDYINITPYVLYVLYRITVHVNPALPNPWAV